MFDPERYLSTMDGEVSMPGVEKPSEESFSIEGWFGGNPLQVGVMASPSSTDKLVMDVLEECRDRSLVGRWIVIPFVQDGIPALSLGQAVRVEMENDLFQSGVSRAVIASQGVLPPSASRDLLRVEVGVSATFGFRDGLSFPSALGTVPPSGSPAYLVNDDFLGRLLSRNAGDLFYLGRAYGDRSSSLLLPTWIRHFKTGTGGAGDTYHMGIFGKTGSGKSVLAKMILMGFGRHSRTSLFVLDPQGEFSRDVVGVKGSEEGFRMAWGDVLSQRCGKRIRVVPLRNLVLDTWDLFLDVVGKGLLFQWLGYPRGEKRDLAAEQLTRELRKRKIVLSHLSHREIFDQVGRIVADETFVRRVYVSDDSVQSHLQKARDYWDDPELREDLYRVWKAVTGLFDDTRRGTENVTSLVEAVTSGEGGEIVVVNLSREDLETAVSISAGCREILWDDEIKGMVIWRLLEVLRRKGEESYLRGQRLNTLVVLDEAHRFIPRGGLEGQRAQIRDLLVSASRETRKYGIGWLFVSQTLNSLHPEVIAQMRALFIGYGLNSGNELQALRDLAGGNPQALGLYQSFPDPQGAPVPSLREFNFMLLGPLSPLAFAGQPLFLSAFTEVQAFLEANGLGVSRS